MQLKNLHWLSHHGMWAIIIHSKYFPVSDWFKPHALFTITSCCSPNLERIFAILNQWRQKRSLPKLLNQWRQNLRHIESMTSKVQPTADYWTIDRENLGTRLCYIWWAENKERNGETPLRRKKYFEWIIKQLLNSAFVGYEEFCRSRRVLSTSAFGLCG